MTDTAPHGQLWLEYRPLDSLPPALRNPKGHDLPGIRANIERRGFAEPVMLDERTGRLVGGHGRQEVLQGMRADGALVPRHIVQAPDGDWLVPVTRGWASVDDADAEAMLLALNRLVEAGGTSDPQLLSTMLDELLAQPAGLDGTGYTADDLDDMLAELGAGELPDQGTDAQHAHLPERGDPAQPRVAQGMHEVGLMYQAPQHREFTAHVAVLRARWSIDQPALIVLRALAEAAGSDA